MSIITPDDAIRIHLANKRKYLESLISAVVRHHTELHMAIFEKTPKDSEVIERLIPSKSKRK